MSEKITLVIGNKNYSSWSLRPWILLRYFQIPFKEVFIPLFEGNFKTEILKYSGSGKVPVLVHGSVKVWESLAICEYIAELFPEKNMWPQDQKDRAWARAISQEMHAGFFALRTHMPMNLRANYLGKGRNAEVEKDIARISEIWEECRTQFKNKGPFLFGNFTVADAMFVPVATRFKTYGVTLEGHASDYVQAILDLPALKEWQQAALKEPWFIKVNEIYNPKFV